MQLLLLPLSRPCVHGPHAASVPGTGPHLKSLWGAHRVAKECPSDGRAWG